MHGIEFILGKLHIVLTLLPYVDAEGFEVYFTLKISEIEFSQGVVGEGGSRIVITIPPPLHTQTHTHSSMLDNLNCIFV